MVHPCKSGKIVIFCDEGREKKQACAPDGDGAKYSKIIKENN